ncbi:MAG: bifunctional diaminohydroxyphosphoribosylaminopyrimidine deaminase/5-amino-6-(5-phosphoribosylamino)uracil reductase RibD [Akkermansiaceae bacterium]
MSELSEDEKWMHEALAEAKNGIGLTAPNPPVGAVIVKDGVKLASGWHRKVGVNHAERDALSQLSKVEGRIVEAEGATIYVTLEPCSTQGRTGSCTDALIKAKFARVVYAMDDPNPDHVGRSQHLLEEEGIKVTTGILREEAAYLIRGFTMVQQYQRPWVIAKTAMSLDGRITRPPGEGQWLTGPQSREKVQQLRAEVDAIITSGETLRKDNPALTLRSKGVLNEKEQPVRVVITRSEIKYENYQMFTDEYRDRTQVFQNKGLDKVLQQLAKQGHNTVLLECGGELMGAFLDAELIDEMVIFFAPIITGGPQPALAGEGVESLKDRLLLKETSVQEIGSDLCLRGLIDRERLRKLER